MRTQKRDLKTGDIEGSYELEIPETAKEFFDMLSQGDETVSITVNKHALSEVCELAMKSWIIARDNEARNALKSGGKVRAKSGRFGLGF